MPRLSDVSSPAQRSSAERFRCTLSRVGKDAVWVLAAGEVDLWTSPQLETALRAAQIHTLLVVLDTRDVFFMDSSGIDAILDASAREERGGPRLVLVPGPIVDRVIRLAGVHGRIWTRELAPSAPAPFALPPTPGGLSDVQKLERQLSPSGCRSGQRRGDGEASSSAR
jgi:anti-anti-sigma factor